jgi:colicin import membrane protein
MRTSLKFLLLATAVIAWTDTASAQTRERPTPPTREQLQARKDAERARLEAQKAQRQARIDQTKEQLEARREAAKASMEARREAAKAGGTRPERPAVKPTRPERPAGTGEARKEAMREYSELRRSLHGQVRDGAIERAAAEAQLKAWREAHKPGRGGN